MKNLKEVAKELKTINENEILSLLIKLDELRGFLSAKDYAIAITKMTASVIEMKEKTKDEAYHESKSFGNFIFDQSLILDILK